MDKQEGPDNIAKPFLKKIYKFLAALLISIFLLLMSSDSVQAAGTIGVRTELRGGILHVEWDPVPATFDGAPFLGWNVSINFPNTGGGSVCGLAIVGVGSCPFGLGTTYKDIDFTNDLLRGWAPVSLQVSVNISALYGPYQGQAGSPSILVI